MYEKTVWPSFKGKYVFKESLENMLMEPLSLNRIGYKGWIIRCFKTDISVCTNGHTCDCCVTGTSVYCWVYTVSDVKTLKTFNTAATLVIVRVREMPWTKTGVTEFHAQIWNYQTISSSNHAYYKQDSI